MKIERISRLNFIMTLFILVLHTRAGTNVFDDCPLWYVHLDRFVVDLTSAAVPTFFSISAFLLFRNYKISDYEKKLSTRMRSLAVPYIIFSVIGFVFINFLKIIKNGSIDVSFYSVVYDIYHCSFNSPIWYVRALFYYVVVSPIVLLIMNKMKFLGMLLLLALSVSVNLILKVPYDTFVYWLPDIVVFSYFGLYGTKLIEVENKNSFCIIAIIILLVLVHDVDPKSSIYWVYRMILPFLFFSMNLCDWKFSGTFFIYMLHGIVNAVANFVYKDFVYFNFWMPFVRPLSVVLACFVVYIIVKKKTPTLFKVLNGNRN